MQHSRFVVRVALGVATLLATISVGSASLAQSIIRNPGQHADYAVELEPHFVFGPFDPPGDTIGTGFGAGLRVTIPVVKNGFVPSINNSVGVTFGFDYLHYSNGSGGDIAIGPCAYWVPGPGNTQICTQVAGTAGGPANYVYLPVALQWNFWLHQQFSVFGEPGFVMYYRKAEFEADSNVGVAPMLDVGGRWHFSKVASLTFRFGYPTFSFGVSFFL